MEYDYKKGLRAQVFKSLDIVQMHKASGLCDITDEEWQECVAWYKDMCDKEWDAFHRIPAVIQRHLPEHVKARLITVLGVSI
jgi:hypothetical protein